EYVPGGRVRRQRDVGSRRIVAVVAGLVCRDGYGPASRRIRGRGEQVRRVEICRLGGQCRRDQNLVRLRATIRPVVKRIFCPGADLRRGRPDGGERIHRKGVQGEHLLGWRAHRADVVGPASWAGVERHGHLVLGSLESPGVTDGGAALDLWPEDTALIGQDDRIQVRVNCSATVGAKCDGAQGRVAGCDGQGKCGADIVGECARGKVVCLQAQSAGYVINGRPTHGSVVGKRAVRNGCRRADVKDCTSVGSRVVVGKRIVRDKKMLNELKDRSSVSHSTVVGERAVGNQVKVVAKDRASFAGLISGKRAIGNNQCLIVKNCTALGRGAVLEY